MTDNAPDLSPEAVEALAAALDDTATVHDAMNRAAMSLECTGSATMLRALATRVDALAEDQFTIREVYKAENDRRAAEDAAKIEALTKDREHARRLGFEEGIAKGRHEATIILGEFLGALPLERIVSSGDSVEALIEGIKKIVSERDAAIKERDALTKERDALEKLWKACCRGNESLEQQTQDALARLGAVAEGVREEAADIVEREDHSLHQAIRGIPIPTDASAALERALQAEREACAGIPACMAHAVKSLLPNKVVRPDKVEDLATVLDGVAAAILARGQKEAGE